MFGDCDSFVERLEDFIKDILAYVQLNPLQRESGQQLYNKFIENKEQYDSCKCGAFNNLHFWAHLIIIHCFYLS